MLTQSVSLSEHHMVLIRRSIESGRYAYASEVVRAALRLLERDEGAYRAKLERLKAEVEKGYDAYHAGESVALNREEDYKALSDEIRRSV